MSNSIEVMVVDAATIAAIITTTPVFTNFGNYCQLNDYQGVNR